LIEKTALQIVSLKIVNNEYCGPEKSLIKTISEESNKELLELFVYLLKENSSSRISKAQYNAELSTAMKRMNSGQYLTQSQVEKILLNNKKLIRAK
jgi:hypothetical protein